MKYKIQLVRGYWEARDSKGRVVARLIKKIEQWKARDTPDYQMGLQQNNYNGKDADSQ
jgi:hypothetical protein